MRASSLLFGFVAAFATAGALAQARQARPPKRILSSTSRRTQLRVSVTRRE